VQAPLDAPLDVKLSARYKRESRLQVRAAWEMARELVTGARLRLLEQIGLHQRAGRATATVYVRKVTNTRNVRGAVAREVEKRTEDND
jgi:hypothetical protein